MYSKEFHDLKFWNIYCEYLRPQALKIWINQSFREYCRTIPSYEFWKIIFYNLCQERTGEASKTLVGIHFAAIQAQELQICLLPFEIHCQPLKMLGRHNAPSETFQKLNSIIIYVHHNTKQVLHKVAHYSSCRQSIGRLEVPGTRIKLSFFPRIIPISQYIYLLEGLILKLIESLKCPCIGVRWSIWPKSFMEGIISQALLGN